MDVERKEGDIRDLEFVGSAYDDLLACPRDVRRSFGRALNDAQHAATPLRAKPLKGLGGGVLEVREDYDTDTYRAVYTTRLQTAVYVLHVFQKRSTHGIATSRRDIALIKSRLAWARQIDAERRAGQQ